jgi:hypothetical protein
VLWNTNPRKDRTSDTPAYVNSRLFGRPRLCHDQQYLAMLRVFYIIFSPHARAQCCAALCVQQVRIGRQRRVVAVL